MIAPYKPLCRKLDREIELIIMGGKKSVAAYDEFHSLTETEDYKNGILRPEIMRAGLLRLSYNYFEYDFFPYYSNHIKWAFQIVKKLEPLSFLLESPRKKCGSWFARFRDETLMEDYCANGDTAPMSICLAALEAYKKS